MSLRASLPSIRLPLFCALGCLAAAFLLLRQGMLALAPAAAGVVLFACALGERRLERLLVMGSVAGFAAFWLADVALATVLPAQVAAFAALALLLASTMGVLWWRSGRPQMTLTVAREMSTAGATALFAVLILVGLSVYSSSESFLGFSEVLQHHIPLVASIQRGNLPPIDLREPPEPLQYHWGQHALAAGLGLLADNFEAHVVLFATNALMGALAFGLAYFVGRDVGGRWGGALGALLFFGAGTLNWTSAESFVTSSVPWAALMYPFNPFTSGNVLVGGFFLRLHSHSSTWPMCVGLLAVSLVARSRERRGFVASLAGGAALALVAPGSETLFCGILVGSATMVGLMVACEPERRTPAALSRLALPIVMGAATAPILGGVLRTFLTTGSAALEAKVMLNREHWGSVPAWVFWQRFSDGGWVRIGSLRFLQDVGPLPLLAPLVLAWALVKRSYVLFAVAAAGVASLVAATVLTLSRYPENMFRLVSSSVTLGGLAVGALLGRMAGVPSRRPVRIVTRSVALAFAIFLAGAWPLSFVGYHAGLGHWPWPDRLGRPHIDLRAADWLRVNSDFRDAILTVPLGRPEIEPSGQVVPYGSLVTGRPGFAPAAAAAIGAMDVGALRTMGVRYLYVATEAATPQQRRALAQLQNQGEIVRAWASPAPEHVIFRLEGR